MQRWPRRDAGIARFSRCAAPRASKRSQVRILIQECGGNYYGRQWSSPYGELPREGHARTFPVTAPISLRGDDAQPKRAGKRMLPPYAIGVQTRDTTKVALFGLSVFITQNRWSFSLALQYCSFAHLVIL